MDSSGNLTLIKEELIAHLENRDLPTFMTAKLWRSDFDTQRVKNLEFV